MPELPEVETTVRGLQQKVLSRTFIDVWTDLEKFKKLKELKNKKIKKVWRKGKNIIFELSQGYSLLVHQKLTGHLLYEEREKDKVNTYIHLKFFLDNGKILALSDLRKFAKVELWKTEELLNSEEFKKLGPEPLGSGFTFEKFKEILKGRRGKIKQVLMDQEVIAGIGNIYSDEVLWRSKIHPFKDVSKLTEKEIRDIYSNIKNVLRKAIKLGGESISDYRDLQGKRGGFDKMRKVYRREGEKCSRCGAEIKKAKMGGRSAHFCSFCQKL
ncbi:MAG: DNA-formamidopyrimidine glycosylase [Candidatus Nealsonbacteria bacterium CG10_big_fil_rev_8_21_14_0_10_36_24]|uniref:DNA-formamidopyrimidine glycosylase n=2 Tax=Candidatus Nealsoniibacteriota TaxID=1817911 RepID=A0A2H0YR13_9BACT|nr:MAG: DNA-formamidopyrimidine glycosylase [Candidatus Nealsonbacteria bacterium CG10_big_fil_rev_8_21_14_0_10_36_24]PIS40182.1 MAG: DNA-formamidopyrimidine glycosylase [Candidatus Nealsonbacteria bacterium CG08_land_8_20_14_0_20_36_22]